MQSKAYFQTVYKVKVAPSLAELHCNSAVGSVLEFGWGLCSVLPCFSAPVQFMLMPVSLGMGDLDRAQSGIHFCLVGIPPRNSDSQAIAVILFFSYTIPLGGLTCILAHFS